jgi:succinate dehydrogenase / fumarate reductase membrane anchor subunit
MKLFAGQSAWVVQRLTAIALLVLLAFALVALLVRPPGFEAWRALVGSAHGAVLVAIGFAAIGLHGWIGARDVVLDYIHHPFWRLAVLALAGILLTGVFIRVLLTLARAFGGGA